MAQLRDHSEHDRVLAAPAPKDPGPGDNFMTWNDYAVALIRRSEASRAVGILESIERGKPGEYVVAANLGTAYELSGDLARAHQWIREGIRRNPQSHQGTEWLHLRILEARMAVAKDPDWLLRNSVTGLDFGSDAQPRRPPQWPQGTEDGEGVIAALVYQLHERMAFVPAPDPVVASLIAELGALLLPYRTAEFALPVLELALSYGPLRVQEVAARKSLAEQIVRSSQFMDPRLLVALVLIVALAIVGGALLSWRGRRRIPPQV